MDKDYFQKRDGSYYLEETKKEILDKIDMDNPESFIPYLKILDHPFIEDWWKHMKNRTFPKYLNMMKLCTNRHFSFEDGKKINEIIDKKQKI